MGLWQTLTDRILTFGDESRYNPKDQQNLYLCRTKHTYPAVNQTTEGKWVVTG